jgi:uncharacterized integral membrane protein (TIGR00698 family)
VLSTAAPRPATRTFALFAAAGAFALSPWATPGIALALGGALALTIGNPLPELSARASKWLLQAAVVGLGFGMPLGAVVSAGRSGIGFTIAGVATALTLGLVLGRKLHVEDQTSFLITAGTSICGGSAIAAVGPAIGARTEAMSVALAIVFVLNSVALYAFPPIGHLLHLSQHQFAIWAAIAIHDTSSVVGAAASYGAEALEQATVLKLARALWIIPLTLAAASFSRRHGDAGTRTRKLAMPWFIGLFIVAALVRSLAPATFDPTLDDLVHLSHVALVFTLFLIGAGLTQQTLRNVGVRPLAQGLVLWLAMASLTLAVVATVVRA